MYTRTLRTSTISASWSSWKRIASISAGSWNPTLSCFDENSPTVNYKVVEGLYRVVGTNLCYISFYIKGDITALNGTNNYAQISGLPFTGIGSGFGSSSLSVGVYYQCVASNSLLFAINKNVIRLQGGDGSYALKWKTCTNFELAGSGFYICI